MAKEKAYTRKTDAVTQTQVKAESSQNLLFGKRNYTFMLIGIGLIFLGFALMAGGHMPSPEIWDESLIYSPIRITLAPFCILLGLVINVYAIFVRK